MCLRRISNNYYNQYKIYFVSNGIDYIDNSNFLVSGSHDEINQLFTINNSVDSINLYIIEKLWDSHVGYTNSISTNNVAVLRDYIFNSTTPHEIGHALGLYHTHEDSNKVKLDGSDCSISGDLICDTPPDPGLNEENVVNCKYVGDSRYNPLVDNLMSYSPCRTKLTNGQVWRIRQTIKNNEVIRKTLNTTHELNFINWKFDKSSSVCLNQSKTFILENIPTDCFVTWKVSDNITIKTSNNSSVEINLNNLNFESYLKAILLIDSRFYTFYLRLNQLEHPLESNLTLESFKSTPIYLGRFTNITARYNSIIDVGQLGYTWEWSVPSSQVIYHSPNYSYIHVSPIGTPSSLYIQVKASNECGCTNWKGKWFKVEPAPDDCIDCPTKGGEIHY